MAYTLNSAKDARGDEHLFVQSAQKNLAAITAYKRKNGVDYETAYQRVTGQPWPEGRSLKVENGHAVMTKDRTVKSVLGKYVAPIAGAVAAPFVLPALAGLGGGAAGALQSGNAINALTGSLAAGGGAGGAAAAGASSWLRPLLQYGAPAATALVGQSMANRADTEAARIEAEQFDKALAEERENKTYQRGQYADYLGRLKPYGDAGTAATSRASQLLTTSRYRPEVQGVGARPGQGMVRLTDSRGQVREVPESEAPRWEQAGARRI